MPTTPCITRRAVRTRSSPLPHATDRRVAPRFLRRAGLIRWFSFATPAVPACRSGATRRTTRTRKTRLPRRSSMSHRRGSSGASMTRDPTPPPTQARPPETLDALRALMVAIARGEAPISLGAKARQALGRILDLPANPALLSITSLAEVLGVNPSTLTRLAHSLGYSGFPAFQQVLLTASMAPPGEFYSRQARAALAEGTSTRSRAIQLCHENQANIDRFVEQFDRDAFEAAVDLIMSAPRVAVYGIRQFHAVAAFLVYGLRMIRADVALLDANSLGIAEGLAMLEKGDVLLVASCAPYSAQVVEVARTAREIGLA